MKSLFLLATRMRAFLIELPPMILLMITIRFHGEATGAFGFYPLEIFLAALMAFILVYFFRAITVTYDEIRMHGLFSSKDRVYIKKGQTLALTLMPRGRVRVEVIGTVGEEKVFSWMKKDETSDHEMSYFRESCYGGARTARKILAFYEVEASDITAIIENETYACENENVSVSVENKNEVKEIRITYKTDIIC
ncbi:MAG: hypothetical protein IJF38_06895 [Clostridia bacterium]|nr:hypothetical protein [Clostridia bacterium]